MFAIVSTARAVQNEGPMSEGTVRMCRNISLFFGIPLFAVIGAVLLGYY